MEAPAVEKILEHRNVNDKVEFHIKWSGPNSSESSWELESNLKCVPLIKKYWETQKKESNGVDNQSEQPNSEPENAGQPNTEIEKNDDKVDQSGNSDDDDDDETSPIWPVSSRPRRQIKPVIMYGFTDEDDLKMQKRKPVKRKASSEKIKGGKVPSPTTTSKKGANPAKKPRGRPRLNKENQSGGGALASNPLVKDQSNNIGDPAHPVIVQCRDTVTVSPSSSSTTGRSIREENPKPKRHLTTWRKSIDEIVHASRNEEGELVGIVKWSNGAISTELLSILREKAPAQLFDFYEERLVLDGPSAEKFI